MSYCTSPVVDGHYIDVVLSQREGARRSYVSKVINPLEFIPISQYNLEYTAGHNVPIQSLVFLRTDDIMGTASGTRTDIGGIIYIHGVFFELASIHRLQGGRLSFKGTGTMECTTVTSGRTTVIHFTDEPELDIVGDSVVRAFVYVKR